MDSTPSLLTAGLAIGAALLYLLAVWRQVLNLETGAERQRQQIAMVGAAALAAHALAAYLPAQAGESSLGFYRVVSVIAWAFSTRLHGARKSDCALMWTR